MLKNCYNTLLLTLLTLSIPDKTIDCWIVCSFSIYNMDLISIILILIKWNLCPTNIAKLHSSMPSTSCSTHSNKLQVDYLYLVYPILHIYIIHNIINHMFNRIPNYFIIASSPNTFLYIFINYYMLYALFINCFIISYLCPSSICQW